MPFDVAVTPDGKTAWVVNYKTVTPVDTRTGRAGRPIQLGLGVGDHADAIVISPDGKTAYVVAAFTVVPIHLAHSAGGRRMRLGEQGQRAAAGTRLAAAPAPAPAPAPVHMAQPAP